jgi:hypothetical protein
MTSNLGSAVHKPCLEVYAKLYHVTHNLELLKDAHNTSGRKSGWGKMHFGNSSHKVLLAMDVDSFPNSADFKSEVQSAIFFFFFTEFNVVIGRYSCLSLR